MADYHTSYQRAEGESTQWEDLQRKFGNLPAKAPAEKPAAFAPAEEQRRDAAWVDGHAEDELEALDEELGDDRFLEAYRSAPLCSVAVTAVLGRVTSPRAWRARHRRKRLAELQRARGRIQFGSVQPIMRTDFVQEVSVASDGCWVVVHLYKDGCAAFCWPGKGGRSARPPCAPDLGGAHRLGPSELLGLCLDELAFKYPATKFVKIVSTECIPSYPDRNLPTVLLYHASQCVRTLAGLGAFGGLRVTPDSAGPLVTQGSTGGCALWCARLKLQRCAGVAAALNAAGPVCATPDDQPHGEGQAP